MSKWSHSKIDTKSLIKEMAIRSDWKNQIFLCLHGFLPIFSLNMELCNGQTNKLVKITSCVLEEIQLNTNNQWGKLIRLLNDCTHSQTQKQVHHQGEAVWPFFDLRVENGWIHFQRSPARGMETKFSYRERASVHTGYLPFFPAFSVKLMLPNFMPCQGVQRRYLYHVHQASEHMPSLHWSSFAPARRL